MSEQREKIEHPSWCDRSLCTAPELRPTNEEYRSSGLGAHRSEPLLAYGGRGDLVMSLVHAVAPWDTDVFLEIGDGEAEFGSIPVSDGGGGFALFELLAQPIGDLTRAYPTLYGERFGWVADATSSGAAAAEILDAVGRRISATASTGHGPEDYADEDQAAEDGWETLPGVTDTYPSTSVDDNEQHVEEYPTEYQLAVNDAAAAHGTFQEIRAAVAGLVTGWLADDPEGLALDAQTLNLAFNSGSVQAAIDERGEWSTTIGVHSAHATMQVKVTREA